MNTLLIIMPLETHYHFDKILRFSHFRANPGNTGHEVGIQIRWDVSPLQDAMRAHTHSHPFYQWASTGKPWMKTPHRQ